jgi:hypothetical protein
MGWEQLHPTYVLQSQQTTGEMDAFPNTINGWIDLDGPGSGGQAQKVEDSLDHQGHGCDPEISMVVSRSALLI